MFPTWLFGVCLVSRVSSFFLRRKSQLRPGPYSNGGSKRSLKNRCFKRSENVELSGPRLPGVDLKKCRAVCCMFANTMPQTKKKHVQIVPAENESFSWWLEPVFCLAAAASTRLNVPWGKKCEKYCYATQCNAKGTQCRRMLQYLVKAWCWRSNITVLLTALLVPPGHMLTCADMQMGVSQAVGYPKGTVTDHHLLANYFFWKDLFAEQSDMHHGQLSVATWCLSVSWWGWLAIDDTIIRLIIHSVEDTRTLL